MRPIAQKSKKLGMVCELMHMGVGGCMLQEPSWLLDIMQVVLGDWELTMTK